MRGCARGVAVKLCQAVKDPSSRTGAREVGRGTLLGPPAQLPVVGLGSWTITVRWVSEGTQGSLLSPPCSSRLGLPWIQRQSAGGGGGSLLGSVGS